MSQDDTTPPTVEEALERLAGRRALAIELAAKARVVEETRGQNRKTRRNNLRVARAEARQSRKHSNTVTITDVAGAVRFERVSDDALRALGISPEPGTTETPTSSVTVESVDHR